MICKSRGGGGAGHPQLLRPTAYFKLMSTAMIRAAQQPHAIGPSDEELRQAGMAHRSTRKNPNDPSN